MPVSWLMPASWLSRFPLVVSVMSRTSWNRSVSWPRQAGKFASLALF